MKEDITPYPRCPEAKDFSFFPIAGIDIGIALFEKVIPNMKRYGVYDEEEEEYAAIWTDDEQFYRWLREQKIPRELAEFCYTLTP